MFIQKYWCNNHWQFRNEWLINIPLRTFILITVWEKINFYTKYKVNSNIKVIVKICYHAAVLEIRLITYRNPPNPPSYTHRLAVPHQWKIYFWIIHYEILRGSLDKFPDFFRMGTFSDSTHMKL